MKAVHVISALPQTLPRLRVRHVFPILFISLILFGTDALSQTNNGPVGAVREPPLPRLKNAEQTAQSSVTNSVPVRAKSLSPLRQQTGFEPGVIPGSNPEFTYELAVIPAPPAVIPACRESDSAMTPYNFDHSLYPWLERSSPQIDMLPDSLPPNQGTDDLTMLFHKAGTDTGNAFGLNLCLAGDQNEDGYDDILVASYFPDRVHLYHGGPTGQMDTIPDLIIDIDPGYGVWGGDNGRFPTELADLNGDGDTDIVLWRVQAPTNKQVYVYYGGALLDDEPDVILGCEQISSEFGYWMSCGDVNGDGFDDLAVSATSYNLVGLDGSGKTFIYFGGTDFDSIPDFTITSDYNNFGSSFLGGGGLISGDINNDGYNDLLSCHTSNTGNPFNGIYLFDGGEEMDSIPDWIYQTYNTVVSYAVNDVNGDGYDDITMTKPAGNNLERAYLFYGGDTISPEPDLTFPIGWQGPYFVYSAGDVNADGYGDIIMDASSSSVSVYYGGDPMDTQPDITFYLPDAGNACGFAGDVNGDGIHDFMFYSDTEEEVWKGQVFIYGDPDLTPHVEPRYGDDLPSSFTLHQNFPNPFNGATVIPFQCNKSGWVDLNIYNILGQKVYSLSHDASPGELVRVLWDGTDMNGNPLPSGVYLVELSNELERQTKKMQILR